MTGKQLRLFFKSRGISRREIAEGTGLNEGYINNLFTGADPLTASASFKFMLAFPATVAILLPAATETEQEGQE